MLFDRFYIKNYHGGKRFTFGHFLTMGSKTTIQQTRVRYEEGLEKKGKSHICSYRPSKGWCQSQEEIIMSQVYPG